MRANELIHKAVEHFNKNKYTIINILVGCVAFCAVVACWVLLEASCAIIYGVGNCILF